MHLSAWCHTQLCAVSCLFSFARYRQAGRRKRLATGASCTFYMGSCRRSYYASVQRKSQLGMCCWLFFQTCGSRGREPFSFYGPMQMAPWTAQMSSTAAFDSPACVRLLPLVWRMFAKPRRAIVHPTKAANDALCSFTRGCAVAQGE